MESSGFSRKRPGSTLEKASDGSIISEKVEDLSGNREPIVPKKKYRTKGKGSKLSIGGANRPKEDFGFLTQVENANKTAGGTSDWGKASESGTQSGGWGAAGDADSGTGWGEAGASWGATGTASGSGATEAGSSQWGNASFSSGTAGWGSPATSKSETTAATSDWGTSGLTTAGWGASGSASPKPGSPKKTETGDATSSTSAGGDWGASFGAASSETTNDASGGSWGFETTLASDKPPSAGSGWGDASPSAPAPAPASSEATTTSWGFGGATAASEDTSKPASAAADDWGWGAPATSATSTTPDWGSSSTTPATTNQATPSGDTDVASKVKTLNSEFFSSIKEFWEKKPTGLWIEAAEAYVRYAKELEPLARAAPQPSEEEPFGGKSEDAEHAYTPEEGETVAFENTVKLYKFDTKEKTFLEIGVGVFRIIAFKDKSPAKIVFTEKSCGRHLINTRAHEGLVSKKEGAKRVSAILASVSDSEDEKVELTKYLFSLKSPEQAVELAQKLKDPECLGVKPE